MRRLIGLIALAVLIFGAWWLAQNNGDLSGIFGGTTASQDASPAGGDKQAAKAPAESATPEADTSAAKDTAEAPSAPSAAAPAGEAAGTGVGAPESSASAEPPPPKSTARVPSAETSAQAASEAQSAEKPVPAAGDAPTFDIVRVEPTGETVIAGLAAPNTKVEVLDGPEAVATAEANERGEWALVLDKPLPPGTHDLAIRTTSKDQSTVTLSDQRVAVAVPEDKKEQPLVVLSSPDTPSSVMQSPKESEIASAPSAGSKESAPPATAPGATSAPSAAVPSSPQTDTASAPKNTPSESTPPASTPGESQVATAPSEPAAPSTSEPSSAASPNAPASPSTSEAPATTGPSAPAGQQKESDVAVAKPPAAEAGGSSAPAASEPEPPASAGEATPPEPKAPAKPEPQVGVAAVEAESNGSLYIAGTAMTKDPVRVYLDDQLIGEAEPNEGGTWLLETKREVAPGDYTVRVDQVEAASGKVIVRAEVPFEREIAVATIRQSGESGGGNSSETSGTVAGPTTVIIKRGDNLWRISRELYGRGVRFSTIYEANRDQIRNPDKIYPGQVFVLPAGDTAWQN